MIYNFTLSKYLSSKHYCPYRFFKASDNACLYAAKLAADVNAELLLFHTMELPLVVAEYPVSEDVFDEEGTEKELEALKKTLCLQPIIR